MLGKAKPLLAALALATPLFAHAAPSAGDQDGVRHLLGFIGKSGCSFYRNGAWTDAREAEAHARKKYDYLASRGEIGSAGDFIDKALSASSVSGTPYQVRCGMDAPVMSRAWLKAEL